MTRDADIAALTGGLTAAAAALAEERLVDASAAMTVVTDACRRLDEAGVKLPEDVRARAWGLHTRCLEAAATAAESLRSKLEQAAVSRRATRTYERRPQPAPRK